MSTDWAGIERRRVRRHKVALAVIALGAVLAGLGFAVWRDREPLGTIAAVGGVVVLLAGLAMTWVFRPGEAAKRIQAEGGYRDRVQREQVSRIMIMPAATLGLTVIGMSKAHDWLNGERDFGSGLLAAVIALNLLTLPVMVMGWDGGSRKLKRLLDDELTRAYRADAMTAAFWVLMLGVAAIYLVGLWRPEWTIVALPGLLWLAAATASLRFALLHRAADRDG